MAAKMFTIDRNSVEKEVPFDIVKKYIKEHRQTVPRFCQLEDYYEGRHKILQRSKDEQLANNRLVCNHAKYISDMAVGYLIGNPVGYRGENVERLQEWYKKADVPTQDMDLAKDASIFGRAFELVYFSSDESPTCKLASLSPQSAFVVYDDTVEHLEVFGVHYFPACNDNDSLKEYKCFVYTDKKIIEYRIDAELSSGNQIGEPKEHYFDMIPLTEIYNNEECQGDFEQAISLIDAYNTLQSDRVNDKEQFVDAILLLVNASMGDNANEESQTVQALKKHKILDLPENGDARWLTRTFDEASVEILRKAIEQDIHKFSNVPCMTDENFVGNSSGVAMRYKMLGFEQITKIKERYFAEGLKRRLQLFSNAMSKKGINFDPDAVEISFTRNLPVNESEVASMVSQLSGLVPEGILLSQIPFVKDSEKAAKELEKEKQDAAERQRNSFGYTAPQNDESE